jgi:DNA-binding GntR family transcriptional regulator
MLDTNAQLPLYLQLKEILKNKINAGEYPENTKIPAEPELTENYGVSRITVRKAVEELVEEGYLIKKQGKGTFVNHHKVFRKIEYVTGFSESCRVSGFVPSSSVLKREIISATEELAEKLQINTGDKVLYIQRKRMGDAHPMMLENNYFSYERYSFLMEEELTDSLYEVLKKRNILAINPGETSLEIVTADDQLAKTMEVAFGTPFFFMTTVINDQDNTPIHVGNQYYLGEVYRFYL